jgi:predicted Fe-S protein YdhL (DUF1289 family)
MKPVLQRLYKRVPQVVGQTQDLPSPCQSICVMDPEADLCTGCLRTLSEIAAWGSLNDEQKRHIWVQIGRRAENI